MFSRATVASASLLEEIQFVSLVSVELWVRSPIDTRSIAPLHDMVWNMQTLTSLVSSTHNLTFFNILFSTFDNRRSHPQPHFSGQLPPPLRCLQAE